MKSLLCLVVLLNCTFLVFGGACLEDWNTNQKASAWNTRLWEYSSSRPATPSSSSTLSFMSYNLQSSISVACVSNPQTQAGIMTTDYVGNQEVAQGIDTRCNCNMPKIIADTSGKSTRFVMTFPWRTGQYGIGVGTSQHIVDTKYYMFQTNSEQRAVVFVKTLPPGLNGKALWFGSTHLDYTVSAARHEQARQLVKWVRDNIIAHDSGASVVVVGDFNGESGDAFYGIMGGLFKNAWEVHSGSKYGGATYPASGPSVRFDHLWYYTPSSVAASVQSVQVVDTRASDHRPLKVVIKFTTSNVPGASGSTKAAATPAPTKAATAAPTKAAATPAPTKAAATPAPTKAASATASPTKAATSAPASGSCSVSLSFNTAGNNIVVRNTGSKPVKVVEIAFEGTAPSNKWNLESTSTANVFTLPSWAYQSLGVGGSYTGSGFYPPSSGQPKYHVSRVSC